MIAGVFKRMGLEVYTYKDFPSRIRGGHTNYVIRAGTTPNYGMADFVDCLVAFDLEAVQLHIDEMRPGGFIIFDNTDEKIPDELRRDDINWYEIPIGKMAKEDLGLELVRNTISLGVIAELIGMDKQILRRDVTNVYKRKGEKVVDINIRAVEAGEKFIRDNFASTPSGLHARGRPRRRRSLHHDGQRRGRVRFAGRRLPLHGGLSDHASATDVLEWMAKYLPQYGGAVVQAEDELAAVNMIIGAAFTGVRSMTATSGPGLSLMTEGIGLAASLEIPIVIVECARAGPSTGLPTKTEQSNLQHIIFGGHGEFPKIVLAPGTVEESFYLAIDAFNLAEKYQMPVFILSEQALCQSKATLPRLSFEGIEVDRGKLLTEPVVFGEYRRFAFTEDHVSPRVIPGIEGRDASRAGFRNTTTAASSPRTPRTAEAHDGKAHGQDGDGPPRPAESEGLFASADGARIGIIGYGSNRGPIAEAQDRLNKMGESVETSCS